MGKDSILPAYRSGMKSPEAIAAEILTQCSLPAVPLVLPDVVGAANHVYVCGANVVRFARDGVGSNFSLEEWCTRHAARLEIPVATTVAVGSLGEVEYMVQEFAPDIGRSDIPLNSVWRTLGKHARVLGTSHLDGTAPDGLYGRYGRDLPAA